MSGEPSAPAPASASPGTERERWELVQRLFYAAIDVSPASRDGFVRRACEGDTALEAEVKALIEADLQAGDYLEQPLVDAASLSALFEAPLAPGDVLCGRFEIVRSIAEGGMGHVFEALDRELNVRVALKVIRPEVAAVPEALARFRQEVRLARTITHPNVCRTFDIDRELRTDAGGRPYEIVFLTMELLAGETLAAKIKREGALRLDETLELAQQMAAALDAAHALGVVHRDMKPANVMLVPVGPSGVRAVITDFGLARIDPVLQAGGGSVSPGSLGPSSLGQRGQPIGTLAYMAPEQLEAGAVSPATDVYGFGRILFEMVTGRRAFPSENLLSGLTQRLTGAPPSARAFAARLPPRWNYAIESCLQVKPSERPQRAGQVAAVLEGRRGRLGMLRRRLRAGMRTQRGRSVAAAASMLLGVSLLAGGVRLYDRATKSDAAAKVAAGALVYLAPVQNETGEARLDNVTELLEAGLAQSAQINLLDQGKVGDILEHMTKPPDTKIDPPIAREIAMRAGAVRVVFATLTGSPSSGAQRSYKLQMEVQQPDNSPTLFRKSVKRTFAWTSSPATSTSAAIAPELLSAVRDASDWVRHEAGESAGDIARLDVPPEDVTTSSWEALADYTKAEALQRRQDTSNAVLALRDALRLDPEFALAYGRLGDLLSGLGLYDDSYDAYSHAFASGSEHRLSRREEDRLRGAYAFDTRDFASAEAAYRDYALFYENDYVGWYSRGWPLLVMERTDEAIATLTHAYAIDPSRGNAPWELARAHLVRGDYGEVSRWSTTLRRQGDLGTSNYLDGLVSLMQGQLQDASRFFKAVSQSSRVEDYSWSLLLEAELEAERGREGDALKLLEAGISADRERGFRAPEADKLIAKAYLEAGEQSEQAVLADIAAAVELDSSPQRLARAATVLSLALSSGKAQGRGQLRNALHSLSGRLSSNREDPAAKMARLRLRGEELLAQGDAENALNSFRQASVLDAPILSKGYLGRAYEAAAANASDPDQARQDRLKAKDAYAVVALHPEVVWLESEEILPGEYCRQATRYLKLAEDTATVDSAADSARQFLVGLRRDGAGVPWHRPF